MTVSTAGITPSSTPMASTTTSQTSNSAANGVASFTQNYNTFLTMLTTQLKNQDPLNPMDTSQFTNQLVEFSQVEQQIKTNSQLSTMIASQAASEAIGAQTMVGQTIEYNGNQAALKNGQAEFSYTLPSAASSASIVIEDANGNTVYSESVDPSAGKHTVTWSGQTNSGQQEPDGGLYTIQVLAAGANNNSISAATTAFGTVSGVSVSNNVATFNVSGIQVPMTQLVDVISSSGSSSPSSSSNSSN